MSRHRWYDRAETSELCRRRPLSDWHRVVANEWLHEAHRLGDQSPGGTMLRYCAGMLLRYCTETL